MSAGPDGSPFLLPRYETAESFGWSRLGAACCDEWSTLLAGVDSQGRLCVAHRAMSQDRYAAFVTHCLPFSPVCGTPAAASHILGGTALCFLVGGRLRVLWAGSVDLAGSSVVEAEGPGGCRQAPQRAGWVDLGDVGEAEGCPAVAVDASGIFVAFRSRDGDVCVATRGAFTEWAWDCTSVFDADAECGEPSVQAAAGSCVLAHAVTAAGHVVEAECSAATDWEWTAGRVPFPSGCAARLRDEEPHTAKRGPAPPLAGISPLWRPVCWLEGGGRVLAVVRKGAEARSAAEGGAHGTLCLLERGTWTENEAWAFARLRHALVGGGDRPRGVLPTEVPSFSLSVRRGSALAFAGAPGSHASVIAQADADGALWELRRGRATQWDWEARRLSLTGDHARHVFACPVAGTTPKRPVAPRRRPPRTPGTPAPAVQPVAWCCRDGMARVAWLDDGQTAADDGRGVGSLAVRTGAALSEADIQRYVRDGVCMVRGAFAPQTAEGCCQDLWAGFTRTHGVHPLERGSWTRQVLRLEDKVPVREAWTKADESLWARGQGADSSSPRGSRKRPRVESSAEAGAGVEGQAEEETDGAEAEGSAVPRSAWWDHVMTERLCAAMNDACGPGQWLLSRGVGGWPVTFPGLHMRRWRAPPSSASSWHVDGKRGGHCISRPRVGLLPILLFSRVRSGEGGTVVRRGSHRAVTRVLAAHEAAQQRGEEGDLEFYELRKRALAMMDHVQAATGAEAALQTEQAHVARPTDLWAPAPDAVEVSGEAGDVALIHPFALHSRSENASDEPRFITNLNIRRVPPLPADLDPEDVAPTEAVVRAICGSMAALGGHDLPGLP